MNMQQASGFQDKNSSNFYRTNTFDLGKFGAEMYSLDNSEGGDIYVVYKL